MAMDCFDFHSRLSDYLDDTLETTRKRGSRNHISSCESCRTKLDHYEQILEVISQENASAQNLRSQKGGDANSNVLSLFQAQNPVKSRWERTPWFIKTSVEGVGIAVLVMLVFAMIPKIRSLYEQNLERKLHSVDLAELTIEPQKIDTPLDANADAEGIATEIGFLENGEFPTDDIETELGSEVLSEEASLQGALDEAASNAPVEDDFTRGRLRVGNSEIWRFNIKTDSPKEMREKVIAALVSLELKSKEEAPSDLTGEIAPGGIQFSLIVRKELVPDIKRKMQSLAQGAYDSTGASKSNIRNPFTWFKNRYRKKMPKDHTRVVIWLSQI